jgi:hypothetical protein
MEKESLIIASNLIIDVIDRSNINVVDKVELMRNLSELLKEENYKRDIEILQIEQQKRKVR